MKTKFYYNGQLVRTSDHAYTHAVIVIKDGKVCTIGCRTNRKAAEQIISSEIHAYEGNIKWYNAKLNALANGKTSIRMTYNGHSWMESIKDTPEQIKESIKKAEERIEEIRREWKLVELEAR